MTTKLYHIFTDGKDEYTENKIRAEAIYQNWKEEYGTPVRLYEEIWGDVNLDDEPISEDCIKAWGDFPT